MKKFVTILLIFAFILGLASCNAEKATKAENTKETKGGKISEALSTVSDAVKDLDDSSKEAADNSAQIEKELIGCWHAGPSVGSGFGDRYIFFQDNTVIFLPSQYEEDKKYYQYFGKWSVKDNSLQLNFAKAIQVSSDGLETFREKKTIPLGEFEKESPENSPYEKKVKLADQYFWKYSEDTELWDDIIR